MQTTTVVVCLPITDRHASFAFYHDGLGFEPVGEPAEDGVRNRCSSPSTTACA